MKRIKTIDPVPPLPDGCDVWAVAIANQHDLDAEPFEERFVVAASRSEALRATGTTLTPEDTEDGWGWHAETLTEMLSAQPVYDEDEAEGQLGPVHYWLVRIAAGKAQRGVPFLVKDVPTRSTPWGKQ